MGQFGIYCEWYAKPLVEETMPTPSNSLVSGLIVVLLLIALMFGVLLGVAWPLP
jgi:hypothetical protein